MNNIQQTIISQYANSPQLVGLIEAMSEWIDPATDFQLFYDYVWNVDTAQGFGLDDWGKIVGVSRYLQVPETDYFGFSEALPGSLPFDEGVFFESGQTSTYRLTDSAYRTLILTKAMSNISAATIPAINALLQILFAGRGRCYANDLGGMAMRYTFEFDLTQYEFAIIAQSGAMPRPAGVKASMFNSALPLFGFAEAGPSAVPFGQGVFMPLGAVHATI